MFMRYPSGKVYEIFKYNCLLDIKVDVNSVQCLKQARGGDINLHPRDNAGSSGEIESSTQDAEAH